MTTADPDRLRTDAEREAFDAATHYAAVHGLAEPPERAYLDALPAARSLSVRRLVRGLVRGSPRGLPEAAVVPPSPEAFRDLPETPPLPRFDGESLRSRIDAPDDAEALALLPFPASGSVVVAPVAAVHGYGRLRLADPVTEHAPGADAGARLDHPLDIVPLLRREGAFRDGAQADLIAAELAESTASLALARVAGRVHRERAAASADGQPLPAADPAAALERTVTDGHPFHPAAKIRRGMSATAGLSYAPEFAASVDVRFVAVRADRARRTSVDGRSLADRLYDAFDGLRGAVERTLPAGADPDEYAVLPVHPWQFHRVVPERYAAQREAGLVVPIPAYARPATPLLNLRTVVPYATDGDDPPPHCKLAIGVRTTNVERTVSPQAVTNGPRATALLRSIADEAGFERLGFLDEPAGACYYPPGGPHTDGESFDDVRHLAALVRRNPYAHRLVDGASLVPAAALVADAPATGRPLVREVVDRYAEATGTADPGEAARGFLAAYVEAVVPEQLRLLTGYGIALESHLQNSYVVLAGGRPTATLVRDFGGIRVHHGRLADRGRSIETYPDSDLDADGEHDCYRKLHYALFQNHLTELLVALVGSTPVDEADCWRLVRGRCREAFAAMRADGVAPPARIDRDEAALFEVPAVHKALAAMRLRGKRHEYVTSAVPNPLAAPSRVGVASGAVARGGACRGER
ncbi:IucA/IucC family protein [Salinilacihabitans rarus]|uniref:IucA/IucC family protein n=1 Tax=Salinilacihabitans rarus TaxID=2961596 RepID=UPI0020C911E6|nr:IucA/IucC family protein [Salinilacihabitans rarus]